MTLGHVRSVGNAAGGGKRKRTAFAVILLSAAGGVVGCIALETSAEGGVLKNESNPVVPVDQSRFGKYRIRYRMARGGMASIYLAQEVLPDGEEKWVALKLIHEHLAEDRRFVTMFFDEVRVSERIDNPNVCKVIDFGEENGKSYLAMEYMHGETLTRVFKRAMSGSVLPAEVAVRVIIDAARGLHAAHELRGDDGMPLNVVHRDISPANIMVLYDGTTKVLDFGVARARGRLTETVAGELKGKVPYMPPEQVRGQAVDRRADIWSLGVVLWEALTSRSLFQADNEPSTMLEVVEGKLVPPSEIKASVPKELDAIVMSALVRKIDDRVDTAEQFASKLEEWLKTTANPATTADVAAWMNEHFADKKAAREALLRAEPKPEAEDIPEIDVVSVSVVGEKNVANDEVVTDRDSSKSGTNPLNADARARDASRPVPLSKPSTPGIAGKTAQADVTPPPKTFPQPLVNANTDGDSFPRDSGPPTKFRKAQERRAWIVLGVALVVCLVAAIWVVANR
ncbi:MAG: serine/threonine protein kinase [Sandaracinaceae bacterium]|nr:serine/threonine protein kinase [Sandaracinaceae bacterium]